MAIDVSALLTFNRGMVSRFALARVDVNRVGMSAELQVNWIPRVLGAMMLRPGLRYRGQTRGNATALHIPFVFSSTDTALLELTSGQMRVRDGETREIVERPAVTAFVANGSFDSDIAGWTDASDIGAAINYAAGGYMAFSGSGFATAKARQVVTCNEPGVTHGLLVSVDRGPVTLRVGTSAGADDLIAATELKTGIHTIGFTPSENFHIQLSSSKQYTTRVSSVFIAPAGAITVSTPWTETDLGKIRFDQSRDVVFVSCQGRAPKRIERRDNDSWSIVDYAPEDGPFQIENTSTTTIAASALNGDVTLTASQEIFKATHVGALFRLTSSGQKIQATFSGEDQFSDSIRVSGTGDQRKITYSFTNVSGTGTIVTLQRSVAEPGAWVDVASLDGTDDGNYTDGLDNQIIFYRFGIKAGDYSSPAPVVFEAELSSSGSIDGVARVVGYTSPTVVSAVVLSALGGTGATATWAEGEWSPASGYPTATVLYEGRLWWAGIGKIWGSISDAFDSFDDAVEGDSGPISRTIAEGPSEVVNWLFGGKRLLIGTQMGVFSARSSSLDEPLSPSAFGLKLASSQGTSGTAPVRVDDEGFYAQKGKTRVYNLAIQQSGVDYGDADATALIPEIGEPEIVRMAVQRQPDTRVHCVRSDGKVALLVFDRAENVRCWTLVETDGIVEDVTVLPGDVEDRVFYTIARNTGNTTYRNVEEFALESQSRGGLDTALCDSFIEYDGDPATTIVVPHLDKKRVVVWADGNSIDDANGDARLFTVADGQIELPAAASRVFVGLPYEARFKSSKLPYAVPAGSPLSSRQRIVSAGLILADTHNRGVRWGRDFDNLNDLPREYRGEDIADDHIHTEFDDDPLTFDGDWSTDARICIEAASPRPATVMAAVLVMEGHRRI